MPSGQLSPEGTAVNKFYRVTGTAVAALTFAASATGVPAPHPNIPAALPSGVAAGSNSTFGIKKVGYQNWAGYAVTRGKFKRIRASFYVPIMNCSIAPNTFSSHWVGLDGFNSNTVEQDGVEADCNGSTEQVFAWREVFPRPEQPFNMRIRPGDSITATTTFTRGRYKMTVKDN